MEERRELVRRRDPEKVRAADRARYYRNAEARKARMAEWVEKNKDKSRRIKREWNARNPDKRRAEIAVGNAIRDGRLAKQPCEVCGAKAQAHHDDYSKLLEVRWLCSFHHGLEHRRYGVAA